MLETKRLKLVALEKDDSELVARWDESPDVRKYFVANAYLLAEPEREKEMFDTWLEEIEKGGMCLYKLVLRKGTSGERKKEKPIGLAGWHQTGDVPGRYELWLYIADDGWLNRGLGTEIVKALTKTLFECYAAHTVMLCWHAFNERGKRCYLDKCGFKYEARRREITLWEGKFYDMNTAGITLEEYKRLKKDGLYGDT
jgi:RimJ/RimL family protein N-acetyltransferase